MKLINFFIFFKTPPKVKKEDPLKIPFKSLEVVVGVTGGLKGCRRRAIVLGYCSQLSIKLKIQDGARRRLGDSLLMNM